MSHLNFYKNFLMALSASAFSILSPVVISHNNQGDPEKKMQVRVNHHLLKTLQRFSGLSTVKAKIITMNYSHFTVAPSPLSLWSNLFHSLFFIQLQAHWSPCHSSNLSGVLLPWGLLYLSAIMSIWKVLIPDTFVACFPNPSRLRSNGIHSVRPGEFWALLC